MSKKIEFLGFLLLFLLWFQGVAEAIGGIISNIVTNVACWVMYAFIGIIVILVIGAGYQIATSGGDPGRLESAKRLLIFSVIGAVIVVLAPWLVETFTGILLFRCF